jgi:hypothetical protein
MPTGLWRTLALLVATFSLFVVLLDAVNWQLNTDEGFSYGPVATNGYATVREVTGPPAEMGGLRSGDRIQPASGTFSNRERYSTWPAGTQLHWNVHRGTQTFQTTTRVVAASPTDLAFFVVVQCFRFAMIVVAIVVAVRRPDAAEARALVGFMITIGLAAYIGRGPPHRDPAPRGPVLVRGGGDLDRRIDPAADEAGAVHPVPNARHSDRSG